MYISTLSVWSKEGEEIKLRDNSKIEVSNIVNAVLSSVCKLAHPWCVLHITFSASESILYLFLIIALFISVLLSSSEPAIVGTKAESGSLFQVLG